jgi:hypothetical protein
MPRTKSRRKPAKKAAKKTPAVKAGKVDRWIPAKAVRVRRSKGKTLVDIKR